LLSTPTFYYAKERQSLFMTAIDSHATTIELSLKNASILNVISPNQQSFVGFDNFRFNSITSQLEGLSISSDSSCSEYSNSKSCFVWGTLGLDGTYSLVGAIPFEGVFPNVNLYDPDTSEVLVQSSFSLQTEKCTENSVDFCLLRLNSKSGYVDTAIASPEYLVYNFANQNITKHAAFCFAQTSFCSSVRNDSVGFGKILTSLDSDTTNFTLTACVDESVSINSLVPYVSTFSPDSFKFVSATGNQDDSPEQFLVLDTQSGKQIVNFPLTGLSNALGGILNQFAIWSVNWID